MPFQYTHMTEARKLEILNQIDQTCNAAGCQDHELKDLAGLGYIEVEDNGEVYLTSLGELEIGYPETQPQTQRKHDDK